MSKIIKPIGMIHLPGVNDKAYAAFIAKQPKSEPAPLIMRWRRY